MFITPDTALELARLRQQELISVAERARLLGRARRSRRMRSARSHD
jgi:hypothetical protein